MLNGALGSSPTFAPMYLYAQISPGQQNRGTTMPENFNIMVSQGIAPQSSYTQGDFDYTTQPTAADVFRLLTGPLIANPVSGFGGYRTSGSIFATR